MKTETAPPILLYDGDCSFCSTTIRFLERSLKSHPTMIPFQFTELKPFGLTEEECSAEIKFVNRNGEIFGGSVAFAELFKESAGLFKPLGHLMTIPLISFLGKIIYKRVAANRHSLPGGTAACQMPANHN